MTITELYEAHYKDYCEFLDQDDYKHTKYEWAASEVFDLTTYDSSIDELFVKKIVEVLKAIRDRKTFDYIKDENNYITYLAVCQLLTRFNWINWGTSIRGAWFDGYQASAGTKPIIDMNLEKYGCTEIRFCEAHICALINFLENDQEGQL